MQVLRNRADVPAVPDVRPGVPFLRRAADSVPGSFTNTRQRVSAASPGHAGAMDGAGAQRGGNTGTGGGPDGHFAATECAANWLGKAYGVRQPSPYETALSWQEIRHGVRHGLIGHWVR